MLCGVFCTALTAVPVLADIEVQKYTNTDFAMDTVVSETLYTTGDDLNTAIGQKIRDIETEYLSWTDEDSQIAKLNAASGETTEVSDELAGYLEKIFQLAKDSNGAFDPTIGKIIRLWDITGENPHVPEQSELDELLKDVGYQKVSLDGDKVTLEKGATLDLGATGKGIGCDVVSVIRIFIIGFMFGNLFSILYSLAGAALSLTVMTVMKKKSDFSILGISVAGGVSHNIGQLLIACLITMTSGLIYYAPALLISGVITGLLIGTLTNEVLKRIHF